MLFSKIIEKKFDAVLGRYDGDPAIKYYSIDEFPLLKRKSFDIQGDNGIMLIGFFYYYNEIITDKIVIFDHGIGAGHNAYFKEIDYLAKNGYTVYAYDHTGCRLTGGNGILGFSQGINDLDHILAKFNEIPEFKDKARKIIGHSWGGYSGMNVCAIHPEVSHIVSLAGFLSARALIEQYIPKPFLKYSNEVMEREYLHNPQYALMDARQSLKKSNAKLLHLQSKDDVKVKYELCTTLLMEALKDRDNTDFVVVENKNHDPQRTAAASCANTAMLQELNLLRKNKKLNNSSQCEKFIAKHNWDLITQQDSEVWDIILEFLNS